MHINVYTYIFTYTYICIYILHHAHDGVVDVSMDDDMATAVCCSVLQCVALFFTFDICFFCDM